MRYGFDFVPMRYGSAAKMREHILEIDRADFLEWRKHELDQDTGPEDEKVKSAVRKAIGVKSVPAKLDDEFFEVYFNHAMKVRKAIKEKFQCLSILVL